MKGAYQKKEWESVIGNWATLKLQSYLKERTVVCGVNITLSNNTEGRQNVVLSMILLDEQTG